MGLSGSRYCLFTVETSDLQEFPHVTPPIAPNHHVALPDSLSDWDEAAQPCLSCKDLDAPPGNLDSAGDVSCLWADCWTEGRAEVFSSRQAALSAARNFADKRDFIRAFNAYRSALSAKSPNDERNGRDYDAVVYDGLGELCLNANRLVDAAKFYETATWLDNRNAEYWYKRGVVYQNLGQLDDSIGCFTRSLQLVEDYVPPMFSLGVVQQRLANYDAALLHYRNLLQIEPGHTEGLVLAAECYERLDNIVDAIRCIDKVLQEDPSYSAARHMGMRLRKKLNVDDSSNQFDRNRLTVEMVPHH